MKLLFICSRNKMEELDGRKEIFHGINEYEVRSVGTETGERIKVTSRVFPHI